MRCDGSSVHFFHYSHTRYWKGYFASWLSSRAVWTDSAIRRISLFGQGEWKGGEKIIQTFFECVCYYLRGKKHQVNFVILFLCTNLDYLTLDGGFIWLNISVFKSFCKKKITGTIFWMTRYTTTNRALLGDVVLSLNVFFFIHNS